MKLKFSTNRYQGVDPVLTNVAIGYQNAAYIAELLFPTIPVKFQSGKHFVYDQGRFRVVPTKRSSGANSQEMQLKLTTGNPYFCEDHALKQFVLDEDVDNAQTPTDPFTDATENLMDLHLVARENEVATLITSTSNLTNNVTLSGTSQWSDYSNSDPFADIELGKQTVHANIHQTPNILVIGKQAWDKLKLHPALIERIKYTGRGPLTTDMVASLFELDQILVGGAAKNTAKEGQTDATSYIWGKDAVLLYKPARVAPKTIALGLTYVWQGKTLQVERLRGTDEEDRKGTNVRAGNWYYDTNIVAASAGYLLKSVVA
jgi:hypothetical protein